MQDRFKFRCFWEDDKQMYYCDNYCMPKLSKGEENIAHIMQCTGLKDKNGKLIYEGDIFKIGETDNEVVYKYVVWNKEKANFGVYTKFVWDDEPFYPNGNEIAEEIENFDEYFIGLFEVIGNIYENPELLESEENNE